MIGSTIVGFSGGRWDMLICFVSPEGKRGMIYQYPVDGEPHGGFPVMEDNWEYDGEEGDYDEMSLYLGANTFDGIWDRHVHTPTEQDSDGDY